MEFGLDLFNLINEFKRTITKPSSERIMYRLVRLHPYAEEGSTCISEFVLIKFEVEKKKRRDWGLSNNHLTIPSWRKPSRNDPIIIHPPKLGSCLLRIQDKKA